MTRKEATTMANKVGTVESTERRVVSFDVSIELDSPYSLEADEFLITVNGRVIRRMNQWQLRRLLGLPR
jgi:hypothetical protein